MDFAGIMVVFMWVVFVVGLFAVPLAKCLLQTACCYSTRRDDEFISRHYAGAMFPYTSTSRSVDSEQSGRNLLKHLSAN